MSGNIGTYEDDTISTGNDSFHELSKVTEKLFDSKPRQYVCFMFTGISIKKIQTNYLLNQTHYGSKLKLFNLDCTFEEFQSRRYEIAWITHTRPYLCSSVAMMCQVTNETFDRKAIKLASETIQQAQNFIGEVYFNKA